MRIIISSQRNNMCGISGYVGIQDSDSRLIESMTDIARHRGPDDRGIFHSKDAALGHSRLSIIDISSAGHQPMSSSDKTSWITYNGELYNFKILRSALEAEGCIFKSKTDTEVILQLFEREGVGCLSKLNGMFAFAVWNQTTRTLTLVRDRLGVKPLYYTLWGSSILFGSEIKSLLQYDGISRAVNKNALASFLKFSFVPGSETLFRGIYRLLPGHYLMFCNGNTTIQSYWSLPLTESYQKSAVEIAEELRARILDSVRLQQAGDVPVGVALSGGLDSSAILSLASASTSDSIKTYTIGYGIKGDELTYARIASKSRKSIHHEEIIPLSRLTRDLSSMIWHLEEPSGNYTIATAYATARLIRQFGKVALIGEGADELFAGYSRYKVFNSLFSFLPRSVRLNAFFNPGYFSFSQRELSQLLIDDSFRSITSFDSHTHKNLSPYQIASRFELEEELPNSQLIRIDKMFMAHSVEARVPFLDHTLVEFCLTIPEKLKLKLLTDKYILRQALKNDIPSAIYRRRKGGREGSQYVLRPWLEDSLLVFAQKLLTEKSVKERGYFYWPFISNLLNASSKKLHPAVRMKNEVQLYLLIVLEVWHQTFIDNAPSKNVNGYE